ncbi:MAG: DUF3168 domain-containing protein [Aquamicrobium sp.]|uniref:DUF3168 domain-containing protein n=1 Tax=Aquamicrobium sp. TaxID=1872579 RepID=UPI00349E67F6|nr:DUF3168 domain-containing protein [Aquamicrobium sp.]MCO5158958.1 DUF3168 domain-containing protein [Aquamicrobium sp.]
MSEASLAAQQLAVQALRQNTGIDSLVPHENIFDRHARPEVFPCILIGEAQTVGDDIDCADLSEVYLTMHIWTQENTFSECKTIAGAVRRVLRDLSDTRDGFACDFSFESANFIRDPSGEHSHGILTFVVQVEDTVGVI